MEKRLGIVDQAYARPLLHAWREPPAATQPPFPFHLTVDLPGNVVMKLRQGDLDAAFLSPIDYASLKAECRIIPSVGVISAGESRTIQLVFREHLHTVEKIAINPSAFSAEVVLAHLVLAEKFEIHPQFIPLTGSVEETLSRTDAVLVTGNDVLNNPAPHAPRLDLVDEWTDIAEAPFVHGIWIAHEGACTPDELKAFIRFSERGAGAYRAPDPAYEEHLAEHFAYTLHEEALSGMNEFLTMAFYHGILKELTDPRFFPLTEGAETK